jgi:Nitrile hydratase beta subunit
LDARAKSSARAGARAEGNLSMAPKRKVMPRKGAGGRAAHDVGGLSFGKIDRSEHDLALWEKRTDAMQRLLTSPGKRAFSVDGLRRVIEDYGEQAYDRTTYYEKWIRALRNLVVEQELLTRAEVETRMAEVRARHQKAGRRVSNAKIPW